MVSSSGCFQGKKRYRVGERSRDKERLWVLFFSKTEINSISWTERDDPAEGGEQRRGGESGAHVPEGVREGRSRHEAGMT